MKKHGGSGAFDSLLQDDQTELEKLIGKMRGATGSEGQNQQALVIHPEQKAKTLDESLGDLYELLNANGQQNDAQDIQEVMKQPDLDLQNSHLKSLTAKYHPNNLLGPNLDESAKTEIFQQIGNVKEFVEEKQQAIMEEKIQGLIKNLKDAIGKLPSNIRGEIAEVEDYLDSNQQSKMSRKDIEEINAKLGSMAENLVDHPGLEPIIAELNSFLGINHLFSSATDQVTREKDKIEVKGDVVTDEATKTSQNPLIGSKLLSPEDEAEEERKRRLSNTGNSHSNSGFHNNSSELNTSDLAIIAAKYTAALTIALTCGPFGWVLAGFMLCSINKIGNNEKVQSNSNQSIGADIGTNAMEQALEQLRQQQIIAQTTQTTQAQQSDQAPQKSQGATTQKSSNKTKDKDNTETLQSIKSDPSLKQMARSVEDVSLGHLHSPVVPSLGASDGRIK